MRKLLIYTLLAALSLSSAVAQFLTGGQSPQVKTVNGILEGTEDSGIRVFKGVPFAAPPVGDLRWKAPQPVANWQGIRDAKEFGPQAMQKTLFSDMMFRTKQISEDCLYLNVWTSACSSGDKLPVLVYFYGGGFWAGDGSEYRYDGESMARNGIVSITVNYRLNVFGFLSHPELTKESPHHASGNYGLMDQAAALQWVKQNVAAFGGDPDRITIAGESAGSISVSAQMVSPLSKKLIAGAIGESGSVMGALSAVPLAEGEKSGLEFAVKAGANSLADLRKIPAADLLEIAGSFPVTIDGYFFTQDPFVLYETGQQAHVPLLIGWNSQEGYAMGQEEPTKENFTKTVQKLYGDKAADVLKVYNPATDADVRQAAVDLGSDRFIAYSTWKWSDAHASTGGESFVYRYYYSRPRPAMRAEGGAPAAIGASHSAEIEYALGNLPTNRVYDWQPEDYKVSQIMQNFFVNFIKTGNPNGPGLPHWPAVKPGIPAPVMHIDVNTRVETEKVRDRYLLLDKLR